MEPINSKSPKDIKKAVSKETAFSCKYEKLLLTLSS